MEALLKSALCTESLTKYGSSGGGCINSGHGYQTDTQRIFVKFNDKSESRRMFDGEYASLEAICATDTIIAPKPIKVLDIPTGGAMLITDFVEMKSLSKHAKALGEQLARLHLHNRKLKVSSQMSEGAIHKPKIEYVAQFGFDKTTCCGYLPQDNSWQDEWVVFYSQKLNQQIKMIEQSYGNREATELWSKLQLHLPKFFEGLDILPALVHGDLWSGNVAETAEGPVIFDPASFYGHDEYDFGIMEMFGGFTSESYDAYHKLIPKTPGLKKRKQLYKLFHTLNHWNHFGGGYQSSSLGLMRELLKM